MSSPTRSHAIVGGGVMGAATAWELSRRGESVRLYEAASLATGASGGFGRRGVRANGRDVREIPLMILAYELWPSLSETLGADTGYDRIGHLRLYAAPHEAPAAEARAELQGHMGIPSRHVARGELLEMEPGLGPDILGAIHCPLDGVADHEATTRAFAGAAEAAGAEIHLDARVTGIQGANGGAELELEQGRRVPVSGHVLLLANTGVGLLLERAFNLGLPVWEVLPQALWTPPAQTPLFGTLIGHAHRRISLKTLPDGTVMVSGGWRGQRSDAGEPEAIPANVEGNWAEAIRVFPALANHSIAGVGVDRPESFSLDGIPVIDRLPGNPYIIVGTGWSGHGWAIAPAVARLLADWVTEGSRPGLLAPFGIDRFQGPVLSTKRMGSSPAGRH